MGRRISSGKIGAPALGGLLADAQTITTDTDIDIVIDPLGTGRVLVEGHLQVQNQSNLRFGDADDSNYVAFRSPTTVASDVTWTLPGVDGTGGYVLTTDGSGTLSWSQKSVEVSENNSDSNTNFIYFATTNAGSVTQLRFSETARALTYLPSTGTLTCTALSAGTITETSSIVFKENLSPLSNVLNVVEDLNAYVYDRKDGSVKNEVGLIAEDVYKHIPNIVTLDKEGNPHGIQYSRLVPFLVECIKELKVELEKIKRA